MKRMSFICTANLLLFTLFGLAFMRPFTGVVAGSGFFKGQITVFPMLLLGCMILYPVLYWALGRAMGWQKEAASEFDSEDEREKMIVGEAARTAYLVMGCGLLFIIAALGGVMFFSQFTGMEISLYVLCVALITLLLDAATVAYYVVWRRKYLQ